MTDAKEKLDVWGHPGNVESLVDMALTEMTSEPPRPLLPASVQPKSDLNANGADVGPFRTSLAIHASACAAQMIIETSAS